MTNDLRSLPSIDRLTSDPRISTLPGVSHSTTVSLAQQCLEKIRSDISKGQDCPTFDDIVSAIQAQALYLGSVGPTPVLNATGIILHTNLGRTSVSREAASAMLLAATEATNLEFELDTGHRGSRQVHIQPLLCQVSGAEAGMAVNNNASGVLLALAALARGKEIIISRGESVEIGGGFRIPDIIKQSRAKLVEVGTTNRTYLSDYEQAITPKTVALLKVHSSNFDMVGFTHEVSLNDMVHLSQQHSLLTFHDLGSGCLLDTTKFGLAYEPLVQESISSGVDLAFFSGDKLLGGPQAGIIVGRKSLIDRIAKYPLARSVRIDKIRLAGLAATLQHYIQGEATDRIPVWQMIATPVKDIERRASKIAELLKGSAEIMNGESMVGGGSLPMSTLPTRLIAIPAKGKAAKIAQELRRYQPPVVVRVNKGMVLLDLRTITPANDDTIGKAVIQAVAKHIK